jgi:LDH2 family malate/lactate/ureidoglycolate dehydrogenase
MSNEEGALRDADAAESERLSAAEALALACEALRRFGYTPDEARVIADHLVDSALCGYTFAGLPRILAIASNRKGSEQRQPIRTVHETPASALIDGGNNVGYLAANHGATVAIEKARFCGLSAVGVYNSYYSGRGAYYVEKIVNAGLIALHAASAQPKVVPPGGAEAILGTNPICFGFPARTGPLIFDAGTAAIMGGELSMLAMLGERLQEGIAFDAAGRPTTDPKEALKGGVAPFAGHKGFGLSLSVQALGLLAGAALARGSVRDYAFFFLAIDPAIMGPSQSFDEQMARLVADIKGSKRQPGVEDIRIPFERASREREQRRQEGIVLDRRIAAAIRAIASGGS